MQLSLHRPVENGTPESMGLRVKIEVQPGETILFPPRCVNCGREAEELMRLRKRRGRVTRELEAPLCADCDRELRRLSGDEERWLRMGWFFGAVAFVLGLVIFLLFLPGWLAFVPRLLVAVALATGGAALAALYFRRNSERQARPEKVAVRNAARLHDFTWRATTLEFEDEQYAKQFIELNKDKLLETRKT